MKKVDETKSWRKKLGHLNLKIMKKIVFEGPVKGFPKLKVEEGKVYGKCQIAGILRFPTSSSSILPPQRFLNF